MDFSMERTLNSNLLLEPKFWDTFWNQKWNQKSIKIDFDKQQVFRKVVDLTFIQEVDLKLPEHA